MLKKITIRTKLLLGLLAVAVICGIIGALGSYELKKTDNEYSKLYEEVAVPLGFCVKMESDFQQIRVNVRDVLFLTKIEDVKKCYENIDNLTKDLEDNLKKYESTFIDDTDRKNYQELQKNQSLYLVDVEKFRKLISENKRDEAKSFVYGDLAAKGTNFRKAMEELSNYNVIAGTKISDDLTKNTNSTINLVIIITIISVILAIIIAFVLATGIKKIIKSIILNTNEIVNNIIDGKLNTRFDVEKINFEFQEIPEGLNLMLHNVVGFLDNVPTPIVIMNKEMELIYVNKAAASVGNSNAEQLISSKTTCRQYFKAGDCNTGNCACTRAMHSGQIVESSTDAHPGNLDLNINYFGVPIKNKAGEVVGAMEVVLDQTAVIAAQKKALKINQYEGSETEKLAMNLQKIAMGNLSVDLNTSYADSDTIESKQKFDLINGSLDNLSSSLKEITEKVKIISQGDLTVSLSSRSENDELVQSLSYMINAISGIVSQVQQSADNIADASQQMSSNSQQVSEGASEQASAAEEVSSSMEEMSSNIEQNTDNSQQTERIAAKAAEDILVGSGNVMTTVESMKKIAEKVSIIGDIAFQTNILALNAAVEAARAGEHGKGFAVVAAEVRKLAERSHVAAGEIDELTKSSVVVADKSGRLLESIVPDIQKTAKLVQEITAASIEQNSGASQINNAINQLNKVTQQNAAAAEEMATSAEELSGQADSLRELIGFFKVDNSSGISYKSAKQKSSVKSIEKPRTSSIVKSRGISLDLGSDVKDNDFERF